jgi:hypothetical protein
MRKSRLLADGRERLLRATGLQAELDLAVADIEAKYAPLLKKAGFIRRLKLRRQMRREIEREIEQRAPSAALYVRA